jgi:putative transposase
MARPYSLDLRERAVAAVEQQGMSRQAAARRFGLAASTVIAWVRLFRQKGDVKPGQMGGHKPKAISGEYRTWLVGRCQVQDFTLRGLVSELAGRGLKVDYRSMWEFLHAEGLSYKKNSSAQRTRTSRRREKTRSVAPLSAPR